MRCAACAARRSRSRESPTQAAWRWPHTLPLPRTLAEPRCDELARWSQPSVIINVNPANSTETSWEGRNDTSSLDKDILTVVHVTFDLD